MRAGWEVGPRREGSGAPRTGDIPVQYWLPYQKLREGGAFGFESEGDRFALSARQTHAAHFQGSLPAVSDLNPYARMIPGAVPDDELPSLDSDGGWARTFLSWAGVSDDG